MAKKVILKNNENVEILPITRGELVLDSSGNEAFHSNAFLATISLPGLMSKDDKEKLDGLFNTEVDNALDFSSENPVQNKVVSTAIKNITDSYLKSADVNGNTLTITDQDDDTIDFFNTTYSFADGTDGSFTVTPSGGNAQTVKVGGILTDDKVKLTPSSDNKDYRVLFSYTDDDNTKTEGSRKSSKLKFNPSSGALTATTLIGKLDGTYVNKLTNYKKASEASDLAVSDSLNTALGKLEYKADTAFTFCNNIMGPDTDDVINKYDEIVDFIDSVKETETDILDTFVTRKTTLTIDGTKTFSKIIKSTVTNSAPFSVASSTVVTNLNSDLLDGFEASTLFQSLSNVNTETNPNSISIKIGNTTKYLKVGYADKVGSNFTLKVNSGTTEGTDKYTYNGSTAKTLNIKPGSNVSFSTSSGELTINSSYVNTTYSLSGALSNTNDSYTVTLTPSNGTATTATISKMVGATSSAAGKAGLVPKPGTGDVNSFLKGDGSWGTPVNTWRPITNEYDVTTPSDTTSLSQTGAKSLQRNIRSFKRFLGAATTGGYDLNTLTEGMVYNYSSTNYWKNGPSGMSYGRVLNLKDGSGGSIAGLLAWDTNHGNTEDTTRYLWWRVSDDGSFTEAKWHRIAYIDDIPSIKTLTFSAGTFAETTYNGSANVTVNVPSNFNHIKDATSVSVTSGTVKRKVIVTNVKSEGYISRASIGLSNPANQFSPVIIGVGTNDGGTTFTDYYFHPGGSITDSKGNTYAKTSQIPTIPNLSLGTTTGTGNAVTSISVSGHTITLNKGTTFSLSGHTHSHLVSGATLSGSDHAVALKNYFTNNKSSIPRNSLNTYYSSAMNNGSQYFGYFLTGYDSSPYGGFYVAHYNTPYYVGISNGTFTLYQLSTVGHSHSTLTFLSGTFSAQTYNGSAAKTVNVPTTGAHIGLGNVLNTAFYKRSTTVNGTAWDMAGTVNSAAFTIYAPTTGGTSDYVLKSNGTSAPTWIALSSIAAGSAGYTYRLAASSISDVNSPNWQEPGIRVDIYNGSASNKPYSNNNANGVINFSFGKHGTTGHYGFLLAHGNQSNRLYFRQWTGGSKEAWKTVAFTSDIPSIPSITATTTGSGNAITSVSASGHTITFTKGSTFLTSHQSLANCLRSTAWVSNPGQNANNMTNNTMNFTYANNAPYTGPIIYFAGAAGGTYGMLMNATYNGGGYNLAFRTRNGDNGTWNSWHRLARAAEIPTKTSLLTNDSGFLTSRGYWANVAVSASSSTSTSPTFATATMTRGVVGGYNNTSYALSTATFICLSWVRTTGSTGWYNETYGGGWYMTDSTYVKVYNNKHIYTTGNSYVTSYYSKNVAVIGFCTNAGDWTGGAASSTVMGANYQTHVRSSGDNLYHYHWTNGANYKILDANNWSSVCNIGPSWESGGSVYCYGVSSGFYLYCRRYKLGSYYLINVYGSIGQAAYSDLDGGAAFYTSSSKSTKAQLPSGYRPLYGVCFAPWTGASGNENNRGFSLNIDSSGYIYYQGHSDMPSAMGGTTVYINYVFIG